MCRCFCYSLQVKKKPICVIIIGANWKFVCVFLFIVLNQNIHICRDEVLDFQGGFYMEC